MKKLFQKLKSSALNETEYIFSTLGACSSKGRIVILGQIVSASGQIFRSYFCPQDEIFCPGMPVRPLDEQALGDIFM